MQESAVIGDYYSRAQDGYDRLWRVELVRYLFNAPVLRPLGKPP